MKLLTPRITSIRCVIIPGMKCIALRNAVVLSIGIFVIMTSPSIGELRTEQSLHGLKTETFLDTCKKGLDAKDASKDVNFTYCEGFIAGVSDARSLIRGGPVQLCVPANVSGEQMIKIVTKYGDEHPEDLHLPSASFVGRALLRVYSCK